jgi:hypothetical protein
MNMWMKKSNKGQQKTWKKMLNFRPYKVSSKPIELLIHYGWKHGKLYQKHILPKMQFLNMENLNMNISK